MLGIQHSERDASGIGSAGSAEPGANSVLDMLMAKLRPALHEPPQAPSPDCFYGDPLGFLGDAAPRFHRHQLGHAMGDHFSWNWLSRLGQNNVDGRDTFIWLSTLVDRRTFALWALFEFSNFLKSPADTVTEGRLVAAASREAALQPEMSMNFAKAVWQGYFHAVEAFMQHIGMDWNDIAPGEFPSFIDTATGERLQPISRWPADLESWPAFVQTQGMRSLRIDDERLRVRQLLGLVRPSRVYGAKHLTSNFGQMLLDPPMSPIRPLKDGYKGTGRSPSPLAFLMAACGADRVITARAAARP